MKIFISASLALMLVLFGVSKLLPKKEKQVYSDKELRETALSRNMSSIPSRYEEFLKLVDTPQNRLSREKIDLGRDLYFDTNLSKNRDISCSTCHMISKDQSDKKVFLNLVTSKTNKQTDCVVCHLSDQSGTDRRTTAVGHEAQENPFHLNTLTTLNAALAKYQSWNGEVETVEEQSGNSIKDPFKMSLSEAEAIQRLRASSDYVEKFNLAFKDSSISDEKTVTFENIQKAIGAYLRTLLTRSDYDRFLDGDDSAMSPKAKKGLANFINFGCKGCHTGISVGGQSIQKFPLRDYNSFIDVTNSFQDKGREVSSVGFNFNMYHPYPFENEGKFMGKDGEQLFRVPILRNVTKTSPYFHNGSIQKIREAVFIMGKYQLGMNLTDEQIDEIVAFLESLEGDIVDYKILDKDKL